MPLCTSSNKKLVIQNVGFKSAVRTEETACKVDGQVYQNQTLKCLSRKEDFYRVVLTDQELCLQHAEYPHITERYKIDDLIGCQTLRHRKPTPLETNSAYICFYLYPKRGTVTEPLNKKSRRKKLPLVFEFSKESYTFDQNLEQANLWKKCLFEIFDKKYPSWERTRVQTKIHEDTSVPVYDENEETVMTNNALMSKYVAVPSLSSCFSHFRTVLVILNPKSGQGKSIKLFETKVSPLLKEAGIKANLLITQHAGHAESTMESTDLNDLDGIVCVGGDGLLFEVVNGLRKRSDFEKTCNIPLGVIAGGSGNGLARSIAHYGDESADYVKDSVFSTSLAVARGNTSNVNITEANIDGTKKYSFLSAGWGILADIDSESEVLRVVGEPRFALWSVIRLVNLRTYKATLSYIPFEENNDTGDKVVVDAEFISVYSSCQSHIGTDLLFAPDACPNDGIIHLTYVTKEAGRSTTMQYLTGLGNGGVHLQVDGVKYAKVKEFTLTSPGGIQGNFMLDGEKVTGESITVKSSATPLRVFSL